MARYLALAIVLASCAGSNTVKCSDGRICPANNQCDVVAHTCVSNDQVAACATLADGDKCSVLGVPGVCHSGACQPLVCGDGVRTGTEQCDGSDLGGADCTTAGFYAPDGLACTKFCTFDTSACVGSCGDGIINGPELCDTTPPPGTCVTYGYDAGPIACAGSCSLGFAGCARFGWQGEPLGVVAALGLAATSRTDAWVVGIGAGGNGGVLHYDGSAWSMVPSSATHGLQSVAALAPDNAWMIESGATAGMPRTIHHWDGTAWVVDPTAPTAIYSAAHAFAPDLVVFATSDAGVIAHDGAGWHALGNVTGALVDIAGSSASDVWVAANDGTIQRWNGATWQPVALVGRAHRLLVFGPSDAWVVGTTTDQSTAIEAHWNGTAWTTYTEPGGGSSLAIAGSSSADVWVGASSGRARHFDGRAWARFGRVTTIGTDTLAVLVSLGAGEVIGASFGAGMGGGGSVYRYRGQSYLSYDTGYVGNVLQLWTDEADDVFVVGPQAAAVTWFDGTAWQQTTLGSQRLALWGSDRMNVWAAGTNAYRFDGGGWTDMMAPLSISPRLPWGTGPSDVWIVGESTYHWDGLGWTPFAAGTGQARSVSGSGSADVWAVFDNVMLGELWHFDGGAWSLVTIPAATRLLAVAAVAPNDVFVTAVGAIVLHWDGSTWSSTTIPTVDDLAILRASAHDDAIVAGQHGVFHFDGARWSPVRFPQDIDLTSASRYTLEDAFVSPRAISLAFDQPAGTQQIRSLVRTQPWNCRANEVGACDDGVDNDCDGQVDHADSDCP